MATKAKSLFSPFGGPAGLTAIIAVQLVLVVIMLIDYRLPAALVVGGILTVAALRWPLGAVALLIAARLIGTASMSWLHIGGLHLGIFEPVLIIALFALLYHAVIRRRQILHDFPWLTPMLIFVMYQVIGLTWAYKFGQGISDIVSTAVVLANATLIITFVRSYEDFQKVFTVWVAASVTIGLLSMFTSMDTVGSSGGVWEIAANGGRETGLGQQPNWFAMNLMFSVHTCFGMAVIQKDKRRRWMFILAGLFIFLSQLRSGSRGGAYAIFIGGTLVALAHPVFRRWMKRFLVIVLGLFAFYMLFDYGSSTSKALTRIATNITNTWGQDVRETNWVVCGQMFLNTWGFGIGPGGYADLLEDYNWKLYTSIHRYPHGIFWGLLAHYGLIGLSLGAWTIVIVFRMARELIMISRGSAIEVFAWTMPATMLGYIAWSFVEFEINDKPFWEFLALYTALFIATKKMVAAGEKLPRLPHRLRLPWHPPLPGQNVVPDHS